MKKMFKTIFITLSILIIVGVITVISIFSWYGYKTSSGYINKITKEAVGSNNSSLCDKIQPEFMGPDGRAGCYSQVVKQIAVQDKNIAICVGQDTSCYYSYFQYYKDENQSACQKAAENIEGIKSELKDRTIVPGIPAITIEQMQQSEIYQCSQQYDAVRKIK